MNFPPSLHARKDGAKPVLTGSNAVFDVGHPCARQMVKYHRNDRDVCSFARACIDRDKSVLTGSNAVFVRIRHDIIRHFPIIDFVP